MTTRTEAMQAVIRDHFVMWHELDLPSGPPGEWRCSCGAKFGFSDSAIGHVASQVIDAIDSGWAA